MRWRKQLCGNVFWGIVLACTARTSCWCFCGCRIASNGTDGKGKVFAKWDADAIDTRFGATFFALGNEGIQIIMATCLFGGICLSLLLLLYVLLFELLLLTNGSATAFSTMHTFQITHITQLLENRIAPLLNQGFEQLFHFGCFRMVFVQDHDSFTKLGSFQIGQCNAHFTRHGGNDL